MPKPLCIFFLLSNLAISGQIKDSLNFFDNRVVSPYYFQQQPLRNEFSFYKIKQAFRQSVDTLGNIDNFSGILTITFFVNYKGESNYFSVKAVDDNYQPVEINQHQKLRRLSSTLVHTSQHGLGAWIPAIDKNSEGVNSRKFYSFKFINGTLAEIFPK